MDSSSLARRKAYSPTKSIEDARLAASVSGDDPPLTPLQMVALLEEHRRRQNESVLKLMGVEASLESLRSRAMRQAATRTERARLNRVHAVQRNEARVGILRTALGDEMRTVEELRTMGVKTFAGLADLVFK